MNYKIHRGADEIGGNCIEITTKKTRIILDFGMPMFYESNSLLAFESDILENRSKEKLIEYGILPDIKGIYKGDKPNIDAIFISHSHQDHYGLLSFVHSDIPIYCSEGTKRLIDITSAVLKNNPNKLNLKVFDGQLTQIKDINITNYLVDHSAFDTRAFLVEGEMERIFYTGDFRAHGRRAELFDKLVMDPPRNIDTLLIEGTMLNRDANHIDVGLKTEEDVERALTKEFKEQKDISFISSSSQNIDRILSIYLACREAHKIFIIDLYTAYLLFKLRDMARLPQFYWDNVRIKFFTYHYKLLEDSGNMGFIKAAQEKIIRTEELPRIKVKAVMLIRSIYLIEKIIEKIGNTGNYQIIYSQWKGYLNEKFDDFLKRNQITLKHIHVSGHAYKEDLKRLELALNPKKIETIHTFNP